MKNIVDLYNKNINSTSSDDKNIELEVTYHLIKSVSVYKEIYKKLKDLSKEVTINQYIDIYYDNDMRVSKSFVNGVNTNTDVTIKKKSLASPYKFNNSIDKILNYKIKLNEEIVNNKKISAKIKFIRMKLRITFLLSEYDNFRIDLDLIKNIEANEKHLVEIKNMAFKKYKIDNISEEINYSLFDEMVLETEFINAYYNESNPLTTDSINNSIKLIKSLFNNSIGQYQSYIYKIAKKLINNVLYLENFKEKFGLKKLLNNVIELTADAYYKNVIPEIHNYYVTDKIDGLRCICYIEEMDSMINIKLITNKLFQIREYNDNIIKLKDNKGYQHKKITVLDCEIIFNDDIKLENMNHNIYEISQSDFYLYIFDVISYENNKIAYTPFENRILYLNQGYEKIKMLTHCNAKEYIKLSREDYKQELDEFYKKKLSHTRYEIDGLIFVPTSNVSKSNSSKFKINNNYQNMVGYKWKPIEHMTIDFFVCKLPSNLYNNIPYNNIKLKQNQQIYILFNGISKSDYDKFKLSFMVDYKKIVDEKYMNGNLFPIQFTTSDNIYNYIYYGEETDLHNRICELDYDISTRKWKFKKIRTDRDIELNRGNYFGNYYTISESIWNNINNPLTFQMLISDNTGYFMNDNNEFYKAQRAYNSFVKTYVLESIISEKLTDKNDTNFIIDLAAGKGQDVARLSNLGFKTGLFIDNDKNALSELLNRKHNLRTQNNNHIKILIQNADLTVNYMETIKKLNLLDIKKDSADIIMCNFAIHYIITNEDNFNNFINLLDYYLKPNGRFIFTCFDGERIFDLLKDSDQWNSYDNNNLKYSIKKLYKSDKLANYGQKIDVLLPFSNNEYYTENLMNLQHISNIFEIAKFNTEISLSFKTLLSDFKESNEKVYNMLTESDKQFIELYQFVILKKYQSDTIVSKSNIHTLYKNVTGAKDSNHYQLQNMGNLDNLKNFTNSNRILVLVNTQIENIIDNIISMFEDNNYKNYYNHKKNKNKIVKVIGFDNETSSYQAEFLKNENYDSIILYNVKFDYNEYYNNILIKKSSIPIVLRSNKSYIIILSSDLLKCYCESGNMEPKDMKSNNYKIFKQIKKYLKENNIYYLHN